MNYLQLMWACLIIANVHLANALSDESSVFVFIIYMVLAAAAAFGHTRENK